MNISPCTHGVTSYGPISLGCYYMCTAFPRVPFKFHLIMSWYPETANQIFGKRSLTTYSCTVHRFIRSVSAKLFG
uniref:Uncharacterized protein n=1 Tax=Oryza brachyantha TaxID=4533 RepID=J3MKP2_ORYBR